MNAVLALFIVVRPPVRRTEAGIIGRICRIRQSQNSW